ncbi:MAG: hypothetical protein HYV28_05415 [Ignavibacteriales bacterium]|nr:hypothetical protein [Ignavibacteriales bacterium]
MSSWRAYHLLYNWTINLLDTTKKIFFESDGALTNLLYSPAKHRLYAFEVTELDEPRMTILDELNNTVIDQRKYEINSTAYGGDIEYEVFLSRDESKLYFSYIDSITSKENIAYFSTMSNQIIQTKELSSLGWPDARMHIIKGRRGTGIIISIRNEPYEETHFTLYDFDTHTKLKEINIFGRPSPFILGEKKLLALAYEYTNDSLECNYTGKIMVYSQQTGGLLKTILFAPNGRIYCFDNYPNKIYYVLNLETLPQVYIIDADSRRILPALLSGTCVNVKQRQRQTAREKGTGISKETIRCPWTETHYGCGENEIVTS